MDDSALTPWDTQARRIYGTEGPAPTLAAHEKSGNVGVAICFQQNQRDEMRMTGGDGDLAGSISASSGMKNTNYVCMAQTQAHAEVDDDMCGTLTRRSYKDAPVVVSEYVVRRLMPVECERLQGFPDGWTDVEFRGKPASDTARYKALGNSMAVPVMRWIGERIDRIEKGES